jgi:siroheme synthase (precorrin-2 oxidase/ferrochelatase)
VIIICGIVTKGNVKIAISTNGKSPTTAKRLREFEEVIPEDINKWSKI